MNDELPWGPQVVPLADMPDLVIQSKKRCPACQCTNALNPHRMCKRKVAVLAHLGRILGEGDPWVRVEEGRGLQGSKSLKWVATSYRAGAHVNRLDWFGLCYTQGHRTGLWRINRNGVVFLRGELEVPAKILCTAGNVHYVSRETVRVDDIKHVNLDKAYWDNYPADDILLA